MSIKSIKKFVSYVTIVMQLAFIMGPAVPAMAAEAIAADTESATPTLTTDKPDYYPGETAVITGTNFDASRSYTIEVSSGLVGQEDYTVAIGIVTADAFGGFSYNYTLDSTYRPLYTVTAADTAGNIVAQTTFTDAVSPGIDLFDQCTNDNGDGYTGTDPGCHWTNGAINPQNSAYTEGDSTVQRVALMDLTTGQHTVKIQYQTTKAGKHAYDFVTDDVASETYVNNTDFCDPSLTHFADCATSTPVLSGNVPADTNAAGHDTGYAGGRNFTIRNGSWVGVGTPILTNGTYAGDSLTDILLTFSVDTNTCLNSYNAGTNQNPVQACEVLISWGGHIATQGDWGVGSSAVDIQGAPYHQKVIGLDGKDVSSRDNQMQADTIVIVDSPTVATAIHAGSDHATDVQGTTIAIGSTIHDQATVDNTGGNNGTPEGTVTFDYFTNGTCNGSPTSTSSAQALVNGVVDATGFGQGPLPTGSYSFLAHYASSDAALWADADGTCETVSVGQGTSTVTTTLHQADHSIVTVGSSVPLGTIMHDLATVTPSSSFAPTGNVNFTFFNNNTCEGQGTAMGSVALNGANPGVAHPSDSTGSLSAGSYSFQAAWAGDTNYTGDTSECENFTVNQGTTSVTTDLHNENHDSVAVGGHVALGSTIHDEATVTVSGSFAPTGNVAFRFFANGACSGEGVSAGTVALNGANPGVAHPSDSFGPLAAGDYSFMASWAGDSNYPQGGSSCENFTVDKAQLEVTTAVHDGAHSDITNSSVALGSVVHDTATVTGEVAGFTVPTPSFTLTTGYTGTCAAGSAVGTDGTEGGATKSADSAALGAGEYAYRGEVAGDDNYIGDTSDCEPFTVNKAQLTVDTIIHDALHGVVANGGSVPLGSVMHDTATVSGGVQGFAVPAPSFSFTSDYVDACDQGTPVTNIGDDEISGDDRSANSAALAAGDYAYRGAVAGNDNYLGDDSACEPFTVNKADLDISTTLHRANHTVLADGGHVPLGSFIHDRADVSNIVSGFAPANQVDFSFFYDDACSQGTSIGTVALDGSGVAHPSAAMGPLPAGNYSFNAAIASDDNYNGANSTCEPFVVDKADLDISTTLHRANHTVLADNGHVALGTTMHDQAAVTGINPSFIPANNVDFTFFSNLSCQDGAASGSVALDENGIAHPSDSQGPLAAGNYSFQASIAEDANYNGDTSSCEPFIVDKAQLSVTTAVHDADHVDQTNSNVALGSIMHDTADVTGEVAGFTFPDPTFSLTSNYVETCDQGAPVANDGTEGDLFKSEDSTQLTPGEYAYRAAVEGNDNYLGSTGDCEPFTVNQSDSRVSTELHLDDQVDTVVQVGSSVEAGASLHDSATVTANGVFAPTGNVDFSWYTNGTCSPAGTPAGTLALDGTSNPSSVHPSDSSGALAAGQYSFQANWSGDGNYTGNISSCENFNVVDGSISLSPQEASNKINDPHTITAHVTQNDGTGVTDVEGATVVFTVTSGPATFVGLDNDCVTDATGTCSVQIESGTTGNNVINATTTFTVGGVELTRATNGNSGPDGSDAAEKMYVNARISITPASDTNPVNNAHTMTVTVEEDTGSGFAPVEGAIVNAITIPAPDSLNKADCLAGTDSAGQCDVIINESTPGVFTTYARSTISVSGVEFKLQTDGTGDNSGPAVKTYVDVTVSTVIHLSGDEITNYDLNADPNGGNLPLGSQVHDNATVTPSSGTIDPAATVTYSWFANSSCEGTAVSTETVAIGTESTNTAALAPGDYSYMAHFNGSYPYPEKDGACERLHVNKGDTRTSTELHENADHAVIALGGESTTGIVHDQAMVAGDTAGFDPTGNVTFRFYATQAACAADTDFSGGVTKGTVAVDASGVAHPSDATGALAAGNYAFKAQYAGDDNYNGSTSECENFTVSTLTINKLANGGNDTFGYTVTGPTNGTPSITTTGTPGTGTTGAMIVLAGSYTVGETTIPAGWQFVSLNCAGVPGVGLNTTSEPFNIPAGQNRTCDFENTHAGATRTQGFWSTHTAFTNDVWTNDVPASEKNVNLWAVNGCTTDKAIDADAITGDNELMGGFWASIAKKSGGLGGNRSNLDKARMTLLQQLLAAELNRYGIGTNDGGLIAAGKTAFCGTSLNAINQAKGALDTWNNSGDNVPLGFQTPAATPKESKLQADILFWDNPTN